MGRSEGTIVNPVQKLPRHSLGSVRCSQPAANNGPDGISVASGINRFREGKQRIVTVSQEDERGERARCGRRTLKFRRFSPPQVC